MNILFSYYVQCHCNDMNHLRLDHFSISLFHVQLLLLLCRAKQSSKAMNHLTGDVLNQEADAVDTGDVDTDSYEVSDTEDSKPLLNQGTGVEGTDPNSHEVSQS